jgi:transitional endoplasmic reticulum ATPase
MTKNLSEVAGREVAVAEVVRYGEQLTIPDGMKIDAAIDLLQRRKVYEEEATEFSMEYDVMPWDGAYALDRCLVKKFGWAPATATPGFWVDSPPQLIRVEVDYGVWANVAWGRFNLPNVNGFISTDTQRTTSGKLMFRLQAVVKRYDEAQVRELFDDVRRYLATDSIYRGKAVKIRFLDAKGNMMPFPDVKFLNARAIDPNSTIFSEAIQEQIQVNLYTPIQRVKDLLANSIAVKRGILLGGAYGTGKTMAAAVASRLAVDSGVTYVYTPRADELQVAIEFAKQYQSPACVVFCEDVDRVTDGKRSAKMDELLNIIDGIDTKNSNIICVLTTNALDNINPALLRPGRLDSVIEITPPDAKAVEKLIRHYGGPVIREDEDLSAVGAILAGQIPAMVTEVVKRAKLYQIGLQLTGTTVSDITAKALEYAAKTMKSQTDLLQRRIEADKAIPPSLEDRFEGIVSKAMSNGGGAALAKALVQHATVVRG